MGTDTDTGPGRYEPGLAVSRNLGQKTIDLWILSLQTLKPICPYFSNML